jgi:hypothetical protein
MLNLRAWIAVPIAALAACATEPPPPGELTVTLDPIPPAVASVSITLTGTIARTPPLTVPLFARATGGQQPVEVTASQDGGFALDVALVANAASTITVTAWDSTGSTPSVATVQVRQDSRGPGIVTVSPANGLADVPLDQVVVITFDEAVNPAPGVTSVRRGARAIPFTATLSADSLSLTIRPEERVAGAVYQVMLGGVRDAVGNVQRTTLNACYTTAPAAGTIPIVDPEQDVYFAGDVAGLTPSDFIGASFSANGALLDVLLRFTTSRTVAVSGSSALFAVLDFDFQADTGWQTFKDYVFEGVLPSSGVAADHAVLLTPLAQLGDSALFGRYVEELTLEPLGTFIPVTCGTTVGFALDLAALAPPSLFSLVGYFETGNANGVFADAAPDAGFHTVELPGGAARAPRSVPPTSGDGPRQVIRVVPRRPGWSR